MNKASCHIHQSHKHLESLAFFFFPTAAFNETFLQVYFKTISTSSDTVEKHIILHSLRDFKAINYDYCIEIKKTIKTLYPAVVLKHPLVKDKQGHHPKLVS